MNEQFARTEKQLGAIMRRARKLAGLTQDGLGQMPHLRQGMTDRLEEGKPAIQLHALRVAITRRSRLLAELSG